MPLFINFFLSHSIYVGMIIKYLVASKRCFTNQANNITDFPCQIKAILAILDNRRIDETEAGREELEEIYKLLEEMDEEMDYQLQVDQYFHR